MDKFINPQMLTLARESRAMSQAELAEAISVTQGKISKYENGMLLVSDEDLDNLAKALNYMQEFFFQKDKVYGLGSSFLFHRQRKKVPMLLQKKVQAEINVLRMQVERLLRGGEIDSENSFEPLDADEYNGKVEKIAGVVRALWQLPIGPVVNVTGAIESAGGIVLKCSFETPLIDAAHLWLPGLPPLFFVNRAMPGDRLRWTLAHEVGHAVMHQNPTGDTEEEANRFASEFLMPKEEIIGHLENITLEKAAILKGEWKVSMAAIIKRSYDLGCISQRKYQLLFSSLSAQGYRANEPFPVTVEEPQVVRQLVELHRGELGYNDFDLARLLFMNDKQFFKADQSAVILKFNNEPFFAFFADAKPGPRPSKAE